MPPRTTGGSLSKNLIYPQLLTDPERNLGDCLNPSAPNPKPTRIVGSSKVENPKSQSSTRSTEILRSFGFRVQGLGFRVEHLKMSGRPKHTLCLPDSI